MQSALKIIFCDMLMSTTRDGTNVLISRSTPLLFLPWILVYYYYCFLLCALSCLPVSVRGEISWFAIWNSTTSNIDLIIDGLRFLTPSPIQLNYRNPLSRILLGTILWRKELYYFTLIYSICGDAQIIFLIFYRDSLLGIVA